MLTKVAVAAYVVAAFYTFGVFYNENYVPPRECGSRPNSSLEPAKYETWFDCKFSDPQPNGFFAGAGAAWASAFWPAYWIGRVAIEVTK